MAGINLFSVLTVAGGLALFLWSMGLFSRSLEDVAGKRINIFMQRITATPIRGFITGVLATAILQSSSMTSVMVVGMVNARILTLTQAISIIIGANVGTTATSQILSFKLYQVALPLIGVSFLATIMPWPAIRKTGQVMMQLGLVLLGFNILVESLAPIGENNNLTSVIAMQGETPWPGLITGFISSVLFQSSSAVSGMAMALLQENKINLYGAVAVLMGADAGTCITAMVASIRTGITARKAALFHLMFNVLSIFLVLPWFQLFTDIAEVTSGSIPRQLANAHTLYNLIGAAVMLPLSPYLAWFAENSNIIRSMLVKNLKVLRQVKKK